MVVGATEESEAVVTAKVDTGPDIRVAVSTSSGMSSPTFYGPEAIDAQGVAKVIVDNLSPDTQYWYQIEDDSVLDTAVTGSFRTHPPFGEPADFTFAIASCAGSAPAFPGQGVVLDSDRISDSPVFGHILDQDPLWFSHMGDLHYYDLGSGTVGAASLANSRRAYDDVLLQPEQAALYRGVAWQYVWDNHDSWVSGGTSDGTFVDKVFAQQVYRERVPHYSLSDPDGIWQAWQVGRVQFVALDSRSDRSPNASLDDNAKSMLGTAQKQWLADLLTASLAKFLVVISPSAWHNPAQGSDTWESFKTERVELIELFNNTGFLDRMCIIWGDRHAMGMDTGTFTPGSMPGMQFAPLDDSTPPGAQTGWFDTGPESSNNGQYGVVRLNDLGDTLELTATGWVMDGSWRSMGLTFDLTGSGLSTPLPDVTNLLGGSVDVVFGVRVLEDFQTGSDPIGVDLDLIDGEVVIDGTRDVRSTAGVRVNGTDGQDGESAFPRGLNRLLAPFGNEVFIRYGFDLGGDGVLWVPLGYFRISDTDQEDAPLNPIELSCDDRMATIIDSELIDPRVYDPPMTVGDVFDDLILDIYPDAVIQFDDATSDVPLVRQVVIEKDRYKPLREMADSFGKLFYWDTDGVCRIETPPDPNSIVWNVRSGRRGALVNAQRGFKRKGIYNAVVVEGEGADDRAPVRAVVVDDDPNSPTRFGGPIGKVPLRLETPLVTTQPQAVNAATILLQRAIGAPYNVQFDSIVNPSLRPFEAIRITYNDGNRDVHLIDSVTIPLDEDAAMTAQTREQAVLVTGSA